MSHKANPKLIGAFIIASGVLLVAMILFFGSSSLLSQSTRYILFFDQSVNGLNVGSPVKFRGVPVGSVERILIRAEGQRAASNAIPVIIKINHNRIEKDLGLRTQPLDAKSIQEWLDKGLLARLSIESYITGQLFVEFSIDPEKAGACRQHLSTETGLMEIPAVVSSLDEITADIGQLIADLGALDIPRLNENMNSVMERLTTVLDGIDSDRITGSVTEAAEQVSDLVGSDEFKGSIATMRQAFATIRDTAESYHLEDGLLGQTVTAWTDKFANTLEGLDQLVVDAGDLIEPQSDLRFELQNTLRELSRTAQSIRALTDYLERNPSALLTGRADGETK